MLTPEGLVVQDSVEIVDYLESRFPEVPAFPRTPRQRTVAHLMELLGGEGLLRLAWLHRWMFDENQPFVTMDFGRSFKPQGIDEELAHYGSLISDRMSSYGLPKSTPEARQELDATYIELLKLFDAHFIDHPYFLGGHPSAADYAVMGAMHAHMGRDPAGLRLMQNYGPRTFRWMEHMLVPEIQSPEFYSTPIEYLADDEVPSTAINILNWIAEKYGEQFVLGALAFNQAMSRQEVASGYELSPEQDQPSLAKEAVTYRGKQVQHSTNLYQEWLGQRARIYYQSLNPEQQESIRETLGDGTLMDLLNVPVSYSIARVNNRLVVV